MKPFKIPARTKFFGIDHSKGVQFHMTGKEWHSYARRSEFSYSRESQTAYGSRCEIWLDREPLIDQNFPFASGHAPRGVA